MRITAWLRRRGMGLAIRLALAALLAALWGGGVLRRLELVGQDLQFRHFNSLSADPRIVLIDIDDNALQSVHEWPWPRRLHAELIDILKEAGAAQIVMDIAFTEPTAPRVVSPTLSKYVDIDPPGDAVGDIEEVVVDDEELAAAIRRAGNVYLAMLGEIDPAGMANPERDLEIVARAHYHMAETQPPPSTLRHQWNKERLTWAAAIAGQIGALGVGGIDDDSAWQTSTSMSRPRAIRIAARLLAREYLANQPDGDWPSFYQSNLSEGVPGRSDAHREALLRAFAAEQSRRLIHDRAPPIPVAAQAGLGSIWDAAVPLRKLAEAAVAVGVVGHRPDPTDGTVRDVPLLVNLGDRAIFGLGVVAALDSMGIDRSVIAFGRGELEIADSAKSIRIPIDAEGLTRIHWHAPRDPDWRKSFAHISVTVAMEIASNRLAIESNETLDGLWMARLVERRHRETPSGYAEYELLVHRRNELRRSLRLTFSASEAGAVRADIDQLNVKIAETEKDTFDWIAYQENLWRKSKPDEQERKDHEELLALLVENGSSHLSRPRNVLRSLLADRNSLLLADLKSHVAGKICFVGYTATSVADFVPSPVHSFMPGVMAHANVCNMVLQNRYVHPASGAANLALILAAGAAAAVVTSLRGAGFGLAALMALIVVLMLGAGLAFRQTGSQANWLVACAGVAVSGAGVTFYRQAVEERAKRRFALALASYTSPAVAARIAERADAADLAPKAARVTCFFADLAGFTPLSERLGPAKTRVVLNEYLQGVSRALIEQGALVNKFMGDGVFAFFNAPVRPHRRPEASACAAALATIEAVRRINRDAARLALSESLVVRIGLSTGEAFVGDYGSDAKLDYTCIGDVVNLGSRLESAGKRLGAGVLVDEPTRAAAGEDFVFRRVGRLRLAGKSSAVEAFELLAEREGADVQLVRFAEWFDRAVEHFQHGRWKECLEMLGACLAVRAEDKAAMLYRDLAMVYCEAPPADGWDGAVEVGGK